MVPITKIEIDYYGQNKFSNLHFINNPIINFQLFVYLNKLALRPFGDSLVILTPFWRTRIGKCSHGYDVNHNRKSGWVVSGARFSQTYKFFF